MGGISKKIIDISVFQNHNEQLLLRVDSWVLTDKQFLVKVCNVFCTLNVFCCLQKRVYIKMGNLNDKFTMCIQRCMLILHDLSCNGCIINKRNSQTVFLLWHIRLSTHFNTVICATKFSWEKSCICSEDLTASK